MLEWSEPKLWRIETGKTAMRSLDVETMCRAYGAPEQTTTALMALAKETKSEGWWHSYDDVMLPGLNVFIGLEVEASHIAAYEPQLVYGLLQTEDYARTLIGTADISEEERERRVELRLSRQRLLTRSVKPPQVEVMLDEGVTRRPLGGPAVMAAQLSHLIEMSKLPNVAIRVVPFDVGFQYGMASGGFTMMHFPDGPGGRCIEPPTVCVDALTGVLYLDKPHEIAKYERAFQAIGDVALGEAESRALMGAAAKGFAR